MSKEITIKAVLKPPKDRAGSLREAELLEQIRTLLKRERPLFHRSPHTNNFKDNDTG